MNDVWQELDISGRHIFVTIRTSVMPESGIQPSNLRALGYSCDLFLDLQNFAPFLSNSALSRLWKGHPTKLYPRVKTDHKL